MSKASVDTNLYPHASGAALDLAKAHAAEQGLKLYAGWFCPFVQRAWLTLEEKKIPYQYIEINPYHKDPEYLKLNPRGLVPTLAVPRIRGENPRARETNRGENTGASETRPLYESTVICEYLDETYPAERGYGQRDLLPHDPYEKARARIWIDFVGSRIVPSFYRFCQHQPHSLYSIDEARQEFLGHLKTFISEADSEGPFWAGEEMGMVDISLAPWLVRLWLLDHFKEGGLGIPQEGKEWARWHQWAAAVEGRESVRNTLSAREKYIAAYERYAEDTTRSEVSIATRAGRRPP